MKRQNVGYLLNSARRWADPRRFACPNCGGRAGATVQRKKLVTSLVRCSACRMLYRTPTDPPAHNYRFYQQDYSHGFTTDCPNDDELSRLLASRFAGLEKDYSSIVQLLHALGVAAGAKIFDFGCSWGYGSWQLREAGFDVLSYEISEPRARYAREKLGLRLMDDPGTVGEPYDVFFSCHVLEHVPSPGATIALAKRIVAPGGLFVALTPNGSLERLRDAPDAYRDHWGLLHPNMLDEEFYSHAFAGHAQLVATGPYDLEWVRHWDRAATLVSDLTGGELLVAAVM